MPVPLPGFYVRLTAREGQPLVAWFNVASDAVNFIEVNWPIGSGWTVQPGAITLDVAEGIAGVKVHNDYAAKDIAWFRAEYQAQAELLAQSGTDWHVVESAALFNI